MKVEKTGKLTGFAFIQFIYQLNLKRFVLFLAIMFVVIQSVLSLVIPLITMNFIDTFHIDNLDVASLVLLISIFLAQFIMSAISIYTMTYIGENAVLSLRRLLWDKIIFLPVSFFDKRNSGEVMSRMTNDTLIIKGFITGQLIPFISGIISIVGSVILLMYIDWAITVVMLIVVPVVFLIIMPLGKSMYRVSKSLQDETASFQGDMGRVLQDIRLVKSSTAEREEQATGQQRMEKLFGFGIKEGMINAVIQPITMSLLLLMLILIFGYGSLRVATGTLTAGALVAIVFYLFQISTPFSQLAGFFAQYQKAIGALERILQILQTNVEEHDKKESYLVSNQEGHNISFENVSFSYNEESPILTNLTFKAKIGQSTAIIGPSGAGKTTVFSLIERFYTPTAGSITYRGIDVETLPLMEWRKKIAYVFQETPVMSGTILSNLVYGLEDYDLREVDKAISNANLKEFIDALPNGIDTEVGERGVKLSGGQRQRLAIARALIRDPEILLLDEATAHLDSASEKLVQDALEKLMINRTTLIIAHRLSTVKNADQLIILEKGFITGSGSHAELLASNELYKEFVEQQKTQFLVS
ncbi:ABC transporter ATP-binding protein [Alkalihalophilus marmarensis]|uniref:ATP-binding cassette, subfamily B, AbcA/BmrA n=1 Tax=Alkalihalophilus marmarensis DSM 21297 TaxID=1188261 RepID=U6SKA5_9BACI|nr:ABC transporter ATP-binding protein [Alkalihalophilus marmarensis]ERN52018.1 hypothetical protein A33I_18165 [Alkalihalophilus marmarensis DSM 21297]